MSIVRVALRTSATIVRCALTGERSSRPAYVGRGVPAKSARKTASASRTSLGSRSTARNSRLVVRPAAVAFMVMIHASVLSRMTHFSWVNVKLDGAQRTSAPAAVRAS